MEVLKDFYRNEIASSHLFEWMIIIICSFSILIIEFLIKKTKLYSEQYITKYKDRYKYIEINHKIISLIMSIIILCFGAVISYYASGNCNNIIKLIKISIILLIYNSVTYRYIKQNLNLKIISILIITPIIFNILGLLDLVIKDLDLIGFEIGKVRLSVLLLVKSIYIASILFWIGKYLSKISENYVKSQDSWNVNTKAILLKFYNIVLYTILIIIGLNILGFDFTVLALFSGAFVLALSLSMQKIASNFLSGIILLFEKAIKVNDLIELDQHIKGRVKYLGARTTILDAQDGSEITVPNEDIINAKIISWTNKKHQPVKVEIDIELSAKSDPFIVCDSLIDAVRSHNNCLNKPQPQCRVDEIIKNNIKYHISFWVLKENRSITKSEILLNIWKIINEHNLEFGI